MVSITRYLKELSRSGAGSITPDTAKVFALSLVAIIILFFLEANVGINLADEGFLWYGTWRTSLGEVPLRDFQSYDPGRYYWGAAWSSLFGQGIMALRASTAIFQFIGLTCGLLALRRTVQSWPALILAAGLIIIWMAPRHKLFDSSISLMAVYVGVLLIENPSIRRHFLSGVFIGIAAYFGRNHGLYTFLSHLLLILFIWLKLSHTDLRKRLFAWCAGIGVGYLPMLLMVVIIPGFYDSFMQSIYYIFSHKATNLITPVPWPWRIDYGALNLTAALSGFFTGFLYMLVPLITLGYVIHVYRYNRIDWAKAAPVIAGSLVALFYFHHAYARANVSHLAQGIAPFLIVIMAFPIAGWSNTTRKVGYVLLSIVVISSIFVIGIKRPHIEFLAGYRQGYSKMDILGDKLWVRKEHRHFIGKLYEIDKKIKNTGGGFIAAPYWPGAYRIMERKSPLKTIYFFVNTDDEQKRMIETLEGKDVRWALLGNSKLDNMESRRFSNTHPLLWKYFQEEYDVIKRWPGEHGIRLLHRK